MGLWYARPVLFVADVPKAVDFYVGRLGFRQKWNYADEVAQFERDECEIIVTKHWPAKNGAGMLFIELTAADHAALPGALTQNGVVYTQGWWGYPAIVVADPDGNQLYFPDPADEGPAP